jgi:hypothetical protein
MLGLSITRILKNSIDCRRIQTPAANVMDARWFVLAKQAGKNVAPLEV